MRRHLRILPADNYCEKCDTMVVDKQKHNKHGHKTHDIRRHASIEVTSSDKSVLQRKSENDVNSTKFEEAGTSDDVIRSAHLNSTQHIYSIKPPNLPRAEVSSTGDTWAPKAMSIWQRHTYRLIRTALSTSSRSSRRFVERKCVYMSSDTYHALKLLGPPTLDAMQLESKAKESRGSKIANIENAANANATVRWVFRE